MDNLFRSSTLSPINSSSEQWDCIKLCRLPQKLFFVIKYNVIKQNFKNNIYLTKSSTNNTNTITIRTQNFCHSFVESIREWFWPKSFTKLSTAWHSTKSDWGQESTICFRVLEITRRHLMKDTMPFLFTSTNIPRARTWVHWPSPFMAHTPAPLPEYKYFFLLFAFSAPMFFGCCLLIHLFGIINIYKKMTNPTGPSSNCKGGRAATE